MNKKQKFIFGIILIDIIILIILVIISTSYSIPSNINNFSTTTIKLTISSEITTSTEQITTTPILTTGQIRNTKKTTKYNSNKTTQNISTTENLMDKIYYYGWNTEEEMDFTRRNCLFIYDSDGNKINGEIEIIYFEKYKKIQKVNNDIINCFLEDKNSIRVNAIIVNGVRYDKIIKK